MHVIYESIPRFVSLGEKMIELPQYFHCEALIDKLSQQIEGFAFQRFEIVEKAGHKIFTLFFCENEKQEVLEFDVNTV